MPSIFARTAIVLASCLLGASFSPSSSAQQKNPPIQRIEVELADYKFKPSVIEVTAGKPVELVLRNRDSITPHDFTLDAPQSGMAPTKAEVGAGETVTITLHPTVPGEYPFFCSKKLLFFASHRERGMEGTLRVTAP